MTFGERLNDYVHALAGDPEAASFLPLTRGAEARIKRLSPQNKAMEFRHLIEQQADDLRRRLAKYEEHIPRYEELRAEHLASAIKELLISLGEYDGSQHTD